MQRQAKWIKHTSRITIFLFVFLSLCPHLLLAQSFKTIAYLPTYRFSSLDLIDLDRLSHLNIAFANPDQNGQLQTNGVTIDEVVSRAHAEGLEVFISIAGGGAPLSNWEDWIKLPQRSSFIHGIVNYVKEHELQGVDVDLEWGTVNEDYSDFVLELKDSLASCQFKMSAALPGTYRFPEVSDEALQAYDWINLMVYDLTGPWAPNNPGPHSPYVFAENSIVYWEAQGLPRDKMVLGVPFYGYDFSNSNNVVSVSYRGMVEMDTSYAQLDQVGFIYYNGLPTITAKTMLALEELSGIMIWELGQDHFGDYSLLKRIDESIHNFNPLDEGPDKQLANAVLYPNPVTNTTVLKLERPQDFSYILLNKLGQPLVHEKRTQQDKVIIDMNHYDSDVYFLIVQSEQYSKSFRILKW